MFPVKYLCSDKSTLPDLWQCCHNVCMWLDVLFRLGLLLAYTLSDECESNHASRRLQAVFVH